MFVIGKIIAPHGVKGQVKVKSYSQPKDLLLSLALMIDGGGELKLAKRGVSKEGIICAIEGVVNRNQAEELIGRDILCSKELLPEAEEDEFYINDLLQCVVLENGQEVGTVVSMQNFGAGDIVEIKFKDESAYLPFNKQYFPEIDLAAKRIILERHHEN